MSLGVGSTNSATLGYKQALRLSDIGFPAASDAFVFADKHPDTRGNSTFIPPSTSHGDHAPATYHDGGCVFSFIDGHIEFRQWEESLTSESARSVGFLDGGWSFRNGDRDAYWVRYRVPRISSRVF